VVFFQKLYFYEANNAFSYVNFLNFNGVKRHSWHNESRDAVINNLFPIKESKPIANIYYVVVLFAFYQLVTGVNNIVLQLPLPDLLGIFKTHARITFYITKRHSKI